MKVYQRRTLVKREKWPLIDGWYWCPQSVMEARIGEEQIRMLIKGPGPSMAWGWNPAGIRSTLVWPLWWEFQEKVVTGRLAHACNDGEIRAPWVETYLRRDGITNIYGGCRTCKTSLSDGIKAIILLEYVV